MRSNKNVKIFKNCEKCNECNCPGRAEEENVAAFFPPFGELFSEENRLYFFKEVNTESILGLNLQLQKMTNMLMGRAFNLSQEPAPIYLHINSNGGDIMSAMSAVDHVRKNKIPVISVVDGVCCSAATFISVVAHKRLMYENSFMLIHQISSDGWGGTYSQLEEEYNNCNLFMESIKDLYKKYTRIPTKQLNEILKKDLYLDAKTALKYGLIDEII